MKIVKHTGKKKKIKKDGETIEQEVLEDTKYKDFPDDKEAQARIMVSVMNQDRTLEEVKQGIKYRMVKNGV